MKQRRYKFHESSPYARHNAQAVGEFLEVSFPNQDPTPKDLVRLARPRNSPIHKFFEWDDSRAAEKYRLHQASKLLVNIFVTDNGSSRKAYEHVYLKELKESKFLATSEVAKRQDLRDQVLATATREISYWKTKYSTYDKYFRKVFVEITKLQRKYED